MASNYTSNYNLCQWQASDKVLRTEFNADNAKIDAAIKAVDSRISSVSNDKASVSALEALQTTVTQHVSALSGKGNCSIYATSYVGNGAFGEASPISITFPAKPVIVFVQGIYGSHAAMIQGQEICYSASGGSGTELTLTWSGSALRWYNHRNAAGHMNTEGTTYFVVALMQAG